MLVCRWNLDRHRNVFFIEEAPEGETVIEYLLRPEVGGPFTALPATASSSSYHG